MNKDFQNILVVNVNWLGDVIFSLPIFKALKTAYPNARIACLAPPRVKNILENVPEINEVIVYDERGRHSGFLAKLRLIDDIRRRRFDIAFLLHRSLTRALFVFLAAIPERVGYDTKGRGFLLTHKVKPKADVNRIHRSDYYLQVIESYGIKVVERSYRLGVDANSLIRVNQILNINHVGPDDFLIVVNAGGNWDLKRWPPENFAKLIDGIYGQQLGKVVIPGASQDKMLAEQISNMTKHKPVVLAGQTTLNELAALFKRANLMVAADTGPLHLANAVGAKVIGLFGPTRPEVTGPRVGANAVVLQRDVVCNRAPCYYLDCPANVCMRAITVEDVLDEIKRLRRN